MFYIVKDLTVKIDGVNFEISMPKKFNKKNVINDLSDFKEDRKITIYNFTCDKIEENIYLIHYITKSNNDNIFRTSIWKKEYDKIKIIFHQASLYNDNVELIEY